MLNFSQLRHVLEIGEPTISTNALTKMYTCVHTKQAIRLIKPVKHYYCMYMYACNIMLIIMKTLINIESQ